MLKTKVKATAITNLTDARYFAAWGVEWLGFNLTPNPDNYMPPQNVNAIKAWVDGVKIVGEFDLQSASEIQTIVKILELDAVQLGMFTTVETLSALEGIPVIQELVLSDEGNEIIWSKHIETYAPFCEAFLLDFEKNNYTWEKVKKGNPISLDWLKNICQEYKIILSINGLSEDWLEILDTLSLFGMSVRGGEEEQVGYKSFDELDEVFEALELEE